MRSVSVLRQPKILVAEDDENDFFYLQSLLGVSGIASIYHVKDGAQAIAYLQGKGHFEDRGIHPFPDILLLDLKLPKVSGHEVLEWLQARASLRRLPVYVLSGSNLEDDRTRASRAGAKAYFVKPIRLGHVAMLFDDVQTRDSASMREKMLG